MVAPESFFFLLDDNDSEPFLGSRVTRLLDGGGDDNCVAAIDGDVDRMLGEDARLLLLFGW